MKFFILLLLFHEVILRSLIHLRAVVVEGFPAANSFRNEHSFK